jgi:hypothetical protein
MIEKMIGAARLNTGVYNQVEADQSETTNALLVVIIVAIASGIGVLGQGTAGIGGLIGGIVMSVLGWAVWSFVVYFVGTRVYNAPATVGELLRTLGYAQSPGVLNVLGFIPGLGALIAFIVAIWVLVASFIAAREALDLDNTKTAITVVLGFIANVIIAAILGTIFGGIGIGLGALMGG